MQVGAFFVGCFSLASPCHRPCVSVNAALTDEDRLHNELAAFLVAAKRNTHAADGHGTCSASTPTGARRRDYRAGRFAYRDVHFGLARFSGQETVALDQRVIWSMVYCGGVASGVTDEAAVALIHSCLGQALYIVEADRPFRGPRAFGRDGLRYLDDSEGDLASFRGIERIMRDDVLVYRAEYCGGLVR
jgi:hypothetical protein